VIIVMVAGMNAEVVALLGVVLNVAQIESFSMKELHTMEKTYLYIIDIFPNEIDINCLSLTI
ncbi:hypothetical protein M5D96_011215, partial [Drosophila gunungcola]